MPTSGIHLLLSLEDLLNLSPTIFGNLVLALILAPKVFGDLIGPVDLGRKRFGKLVHVIKGSSDGFGSSDITTFPAVQASATQIVDGDIGAIGIGQRRVRRELIFGEVRSIGKRVFVCSMS